MSENKKYYWLKLKENFFDDDTISFVEEQPNGMLYTNFYLKLCLKSLKTDGYLYRIVGENIIPYDVNSLSKLTNTSVDTVRVAMEIFEKIGLVQILDTGAIYLMQINELVGSETRQAETMRRKRAIENSNGNNVTQISNNVTQMLPKCYTEIKRKEIRDKEIRDKEIVDSKTTSSETKVSSDDKPPKKIKHKYGEYEHVLLTDEEYIKLQNEYSNLQELITYLDEYIEMKGYKAKSHYLAIKKWVIDAVKKNNKTSESEFDIEREKFLQEMREREKNENR